MLSGKKQRRTEKRVKRKANSLGKIADEACLARPDYPPIVNTGARVESSTVQQNLCHGLARIAGDKATFSYRTKSERLARKGYGGTAPRKSQGLFTGISKFWRRFLYTFIRTRMAGRASGNSIRIIGTDYLSLLLSPRSYQFTLRRIPFDRWREPYSTIPCSRCLKRYGRFCRRLCSGRWLTCAAAFSQVFRRKKTMGHIASSSRLSTTLFRNGKVTAPL